MKEISRLEKLGVNIKQQICYDRKRIGRWWGKTYFYFDKQNNRLYYENFSPFLLFLRLLGCKKKFTEEGLNDWLKAKKVYVFDDEKKPALKASVLALNFYAQKKERLLRLSWEYNSDQAIIDLFEKDGIDVNMILDSKGTTFLSIAYEKGRMEIVRYLIEKGAALRP